jgi:hypothetical protein
MDVIEHDKEFVDCFIVTLENSYALSAKYGWLLPSGLRLFEGILIHGAQIPRELLHMNADHILVDLYQ